jgi:dihydrofolate reductase
MILSLVAAMANQRVIGLNNQMPWHMPADLAHFKKVTLGKPVIMGRKTYDSIGRLLPGRRNIIISRQAKPAGLAADWVHSLDEALALVTEIPEVMIIGGADLYRQTVAIADRLYLTEIDLETDGDAFFPDYQAAADWSVMTEELHQADAQNPHNYRFLQLTRKC